MSEAATAGSIELVIEAVPAIWAASRYVDRSRR